jgi:DNA-binding XRE family transcriptional regulator
MLFGFGLRTQPVKQLPGVLKDSPGGHFGGMFHSGSRQQEPAVTKQQFAKIRNILGKTQKEMAQILGTSIKAVQSFEQGWRRVPTHTERQALFLLSSRLSGGRKDTPCWTLRTCPEDIKHSCPAWEFHAGHLCWFVNGTVCHGEIQSSWQKKMTICRRCEVFQDRFRTSL